MLMGTTTTTTTTLYLHPPKAMEQQHRNETILSSFWPHSKFHREARTTPKEVIFYKQLDENALKHTTHRPEFKIMEATDGRPCEMSATDDRNERR